MKSVIPLTIFLLIVYLSILVPKAPDEFQFYAISIMLKFNSAWILFHCIHLLRNELEVNSHDGKWKFLYMMKTFFPFYYI